MATNKQDLGPDLKAVVYDVVAAGLAEREVAVTLPDGSQKPIQLFAADPLDWADFPCIGINLVADAESQSHVGDSLDDELVAEEGEVYAGQSAIFLQQVEVKLWTTNVNQRDRLGRLLKLILFGGRGTSHAPGPFLTTPGISVPRIAGGHDEGVSDTSGQFAPHAIYARTYYVSALCELSIQEPAGEPITEILTLGEAVELNPIAQLETELTAESL